jgi:hypothetical protein
MPGLNMTAAAGGAWTLEEATVKPLFGGALTAAFPDRFKVRRSLKVHNHEVMINTYANKLGLRGDPAGRHKEML